MEVCCAKFWAEITETKTLKLNYAPFRLTANEDVYMVHLVSLQHIVSTGHGICDISGGLSVGPDFNLPAPCVYRPSLFRFSIYN